MPYLSPIGGFTRQYNSQIVTHSCEFQAINFLEIGARTAIIRIPNTSKLVIWSSIPPSPELTKALELAGGKDHEIAAVIVPDAAHTIAAKPLKELYPDTALVGPQGVKAAKLDHTIDSGNEIIKGETLDPILKDFEFLYLPGHMNKELITYYKPTKTLLAADLLFNVPYDGKTDQYHESLQTRGLAGYLTRYLNPDGFFGKLMSKTLFPNTPENREGLKTILNWDIDGYILSHGACLGNDAKEELRKNFATYLE